jgi:DNA-binding NtrC family response regulator
VRELRNVLERAALIADGPTLDAGDIGRALALDGKATLAPPRALAHAGREALRAAVAAHAGDRRALAQSLGLSLRTLYRKLRELDEETG